MRRDINTYEARSLAQTLDCVEADLVKLNHKVYRVRKRLEEVVGERVGHDYNMHVEFNREELQEVMKAGDSALMSWMERRLCGD